MCKRYCLKSKQCWQRGVAEYYGFQDKQVVKRLLECEWRKERNLEVGILPRGQTQQQMGNWHLLDSHQTRRIVPVYDPRPLWQQHCGLQNWNRTNGESGSGHHSSGHEAREKEDRCRVVAPQRSKLSIYIPSIFPADSSIRHYTVHVKKGKSAW